MIALGIAEDEIVTDVPSVGSLVGSVDSPFSWTGPADLIDPSKGRLVRVVSQRTQDRLYTLGFRRVNDERVRMKGVHGGVVMFQPRALADRAKKDREAIDRRKTTGTQNTRDTLPVSTPGGMVAARGKHKSKWTPANVSD